ncbi:IS5 family transposase ISPsy19 [Pseudomonas fluorescens]|uniref:IS5 family transposase ISPsy19 n=1 Tax=Pseudomonas fluorescens TaxID=294 RepID=A0A5E6XWZ3_PSEFL|nr:transposase [Pseudomonas fluorescens]VVN45347.1 IS5 family transposase ISPsy19 [Pseudomonas fluorescens]
MTLKSRDSKLGANEIKVLVSTIESNPLATLIEIGAELTRRTGLIATKQTIKTTLLRSGMALMCNGTVVNVEPPSQTAIRYGYNNAHRPAEFDEVYPDFLTDAEWACVKDIFENDCGLPPRYDRRTLVDACCYVVRTGCAWRMLAKHFPRWQTVYRTFRRWSEQDKFEQMQTRL